MAQNNGFREEPLRTDLPRWGRIGLAASLAALGALGTYVTIRESDRLGVLLGALAVGIVITLIGLGWPYLLRAIRRVQRYPRLLDHVGGLERTNSQLKTRNQELLEGSNYDQGVEEGKKQGLASVFTAIEAAPIPEIVELVVHAEGVRLIGVVDETKGVVYPGIRFTVETSHAQEIKGVVEVDAVTSPTSVVLKCVDERVPEFWRFLERRAPNEPHPPEGITLGGYFADPPTDWDSWPAEFGEALKRLIVRAGSALK